MDPSASSDSLHLRATLTSAVHGGGAEKVDTDGSIIDYSLYTGAPSLRYRVGKVLRKPCSL